MISRRGFLVGAASAGLLSRIASSEPRRAPLRLLIVHKPVGSVSEQYDCIGNGRDFQLSPILEPFADLREQMVIVDGLECRKQANTPGEDHANLITTFMTGGIPFKPDGSNTPLMARRSVDQIFADRVGSGPIHSLQLTADDGGTQFLMRVLSSAGYGEPLPPEQSPLAAFARVFGSIGETAQQKQSVLDFTRRDLGRLRDKLGTADRERLDRHLTAIREVEQVAQRLALDVGPLQQEARAAQGHAAIGRAHLDIVRTAFACDLTRVAVLTWGSWTADVSKFVPGVATIGYHDLSHGTNFTDQAAVHRWYNEQLAAFLRTLRDTLDVDGNSLLDNTLVVNWTEMRLGAHVYDNLPIQLFGGAGKRLAGGRVMRYPGHSTNDLWRTVLNAIGDDREVFGDEDKNSGRLPRLFEDMPVEPRGTLAPRERE